MMNPIMQIFLIINNKIRLLLIINNYQLKHRIRYKLIISQIKRLKQWKVMMLIC